MIQHIVLLKWKADTTDEQITRPSSEAQALVKRDRQRRTGDVGPQPRQRRPRLHACDHRQALRRSARGYLDHPARQRYLADALAPIEEERIEVDLPGGSSTTIARPATAQLGVGGDAATVGERRRGRPALGGAAPRGLESRRAPRPAARLERPVATWDDVRRIALALPETTEVISRENLQWRVKDRSFVWQRPLRRSDLRRSARRTQGADPRRSGSSISAPRGRCSPRIRRLLHHSPLRRLSRGAGAARSHRLDDLRGGDRRGLAGASAQAAWRTRISTRCRSGSPDERP